MGQAYSSPFPVAMFNSPCNCVWQHGQSVVKQGSSFEPIACGFYQKSVIMHAGPL